MRAVCFVFWIFLSLHFKLQKAPTSSKVERKTLADTMRYDMVTRGRRKEAAAANFNETVTTRSSRARIDGDIVACFHDPGRLDHLPGGGCPSGNRRGGDVPSVVPMWLPSVQST